MASNEKIKVLKKIYTSIRNKEMASNKKSKALKEIYTTIRNKTIANVRSCFCFLV